jgi:hypothetical protein
LFRPRSDGRISLISHCARARMVACSALLAPCSLSREVGRERERENEERRNGQIRMKRDKTRADSRKSTFCHAATFGRHSWQTSRDDAPSGPNSFTLKRIFTMGIPRGDPFIFEMFSPCASLSESPPGLLTKDIRRDNELLWRSGERASVTVTIRFRGAEPESPLSRKDAAGMM